MYRLKYSDTEIVAVLDAFGVKRGSLSKSESKQLFFRLILEICLLVTPTGEIERHSGQDYAMITGDDIVRAVRAMPTEEREGVLATCLRQAGLKVVA